MDVPFTAERFFEGFASYNRAWWPAQVLLVALAVLVALLALRPPRFARAFGWRVLAGLWAWCAIAYHLLAFTLVHRSGYGFALLFLLQSGLLAELARRSTLAFRFRADASGWAGAGILAYALAAYPLLGAALGHRYPAVPTFGAPCPLVIYTFGLLLWTDGPVPVRVLVIPTLWSVLGISAALNFGVHQDWGLPLAAAISLALLLRRNRRARAAGSRMHEEAAAAPAASPVTVARQCAAVAP